MKKLVLMVTMVVSCVFMSQNGYAQAGQDGNTDIDMLSMKNFYAVDIVDVDLAAQEAIYNAYENCLIKEVYKSNGSGSPIQYKVSLERKTDKSSFFLLFLLLLPLKQVLLSFSGYGIKREPGGNPGQTTLL